MKFTFRLVTAIWLGALLVVASFAFVQVREERERLTVDLERRAVLLGESLKEALEPVVARGSKPAVERILKRFSTATRALAVYDRYDSLLLATPDLTPALPPVFPEVTEALVSGNVTSGFRRLGDQNRYVYAAPLHRDDRVVGALAVVLDAGHLSVAEWGVWRKYALHFVVLASVVSLIALVIVQSAVTRPMAQISAWTRALRTGRQVPPPSIPDAKLFGPLAGEVVRLARSMQRAQAAAEQEAALRLSGETIWTEERLKQYVSLTLEGRSLVVVSNREPVSHYWRNGKIHPQIPASGLVTAMGPVMRVCGGVWVAHGSGDADVETADARGRLGLPEDDPRYTLRRVAHQGGGAGLLLRLRQRRALAPLSHRPHAAHLPPGRLRPLPGREPEVRGDGADRDPRRGEPARADPGLPLRAAPGARQGRAARRARRDLLAHSVAELRGVRDLPLAGGAARGHAGRGPHQLSHPVPLQQLPRDGRPRAPGADRLGEIRGHAR